MFNRISRAALAFLAFASLGLAGRNASDASPLADGDPPPKTPDPTATLGHWYNHDMRNLMRKLNFTNATIVKVPSATDAKVKCLIMIAATDSSHNIPSGASDSDWYPGAIVENVTVNPCRDAAFDLNQGDELLWLVQFKKTPPPGANEVGLSQVAKLGNHWWSGDDPTGTTRGTKTLKNCGHRSNPRQADGANIYFNTNELCKTLSDNGHDPVAVAKAFEILLTQRALSPQSARTDPLVLWFACGGDCCYAEF